MPFLNTITAIRLVVGVVGVFHIGTIVIWLIRILVGHEQLL